MLPEAFALPAGRRLGSVYLGVFTSSNMACAALSQASTSNTGIRILFACICAIWNFNLERSNPLRANVAKTTASRSSSSSVKSSGSSRQTRRTDFIRSLKSMISAALLSAKHSMGTRWHTSNCQSSKNSNRDYWRLELHDNASRKLNGQKTAASVNRRQGIVTFASFTCQPRGALEDRMEEKQRFRELAIVANPLENRLFLASVTMPGISFWRHRRRCRIMQKCPKRNLPLHFIRSK